MSKKQQMMDIDDGQDDQEDFDEEQSILFPN